MLPGFFSSHFLTARMSLRLAPPATLVTMSVTRSLLSTLPDLFFLELLSPCPISIDMMLDISTELSWIVSG